MKKILLLSAVLLGAASASQAAVRFDLRLGLPLPPPPAVFIGRPAPVVVAPAPVRAAPAPVYAPVVLAPPSVYLGFGPGCYDYRYPRYYGHGYHHYYGHGWDHRGYRGNWGHSHGWR